MDDDLEMEFRAGLQRAGLVVPPERYAIMREAFINYRRLVAVLDKPLPYAAEPGPAWTPGPKP
jgi:hypothetical protein